MLAAREILCGSVVHKLPEKHVFSRCVCILLSEEPSFVVVITNFMGYHRKKKLTHDISFACIVHAYSGYIYICIDFLLLCIYLYYRQFPMRKPFNM